MYIDPTYSELLVNELQDDFDIVVLKQTYTQLSRYTLRFRDLVYEEKVKYEKNNVLDYCVACAKVSEGKGGDIMIAKNRKNKWERIDLLVTLIFCYVEFYSEKKKKDFNKIFDDKYIV
ncbi:terminase TerL endonuclease subunit [Clostridium sartagoforme]|uniref:terminase TerL endonuclease subunit n=1 Tax=Clostridium sartagoforme TaxID=84031 RepID=UPI0031012B3B